jgi:hypothetical protein
MRIAVIIPTLGNNKERMLNAINSVNATGIQSTIVIVCPEIARVRSMAIETSGDLIFLEDLGNSVFSALNLGINNIKDSCDYYCFLGDDDSLELDGFKKLYEVATQKRFDVIYGGIKYLSDNEKILFTNHSGPFLSKFLLWIPNLIPHPGTLVNVEIWKRLEGYNESYKLASDLDFWLRSRKFAKFKFVNSVAANFRFSQSTLTGGQRGTSIAESSHIRRMNASFIGRIILNVWNPLQVAVAERMLGHNLKKNGGF